MSEPWPTVTLRLSGIVVSVHVGDVSKRSDRQRWVVRVYLRLSAAASAARDASQRLLAAGREVGLVASRSRWLRQLGRLPQPGEQLDCLADPQGEPWLALQQVGWVDAGQRHHDDA